MATALITQHHVVKFSSLVQTFEPRLPERCHLASTFLDTDGRDASLRIVIPTLLNGLLQRLDSLLTSYKLRWWFYVPLDTKQIISQTFFPAHLLAW